MAASVDLFAMDGTVKLLDDHRSSSDDESGYNSLGAAVVSSSVSEDLIGLNIVSYIGGKKCSHPWPSLANSMANFRFPLQQNEVIAASPNSFDDDILSLCANDEDTKFVDDILIGERQIETPIRNGKRRYETRIVFFFRRNRIAQFYSKSIF